MSRPTHGVERLLGVPGGRAAPDGLTWGHVAGMVAGAKHDGTPCEACGYDRPDPAALTRMVAFLAALRVAGFPPPWAVYAHCGGAVFAEWVFGWRGPGSAHTRLVADSCPRGPGVVSTHVSDGTGPAVFADIAV